MEGSCKGMVEFVSEAYRCPNPDCECYGKLLIYNLEKGEFT